MSTTKTISRVSLEGPEAAAASRRGRKSPPRSPLPNNDAAGLASSSSSHSRSRSKRSSDGGAIATTAAANALASSRSRSPKRSSDGGAPAAAAAAAHIMASKPAPIKARGRSRSDHVRSSVPLEDFDDGDEGSSPPKRITSTTKSEHARTIPLEDGDGSPPKRISNRIKALRSLSPKAPTKRSSSSAHNNRSLSPMPTTNPTTNGSDSNISGTGEKKKLKVKRASSHSDSRSAAAAAANNKRREAFQKTNSVRSQRLVDMDVPKGGSNDDADALSDDSFENAAREAVASRSKSETLPEPAPLQRSLSGPSPNNKSSGRPGMGGMTKTKSERFAMIKSGSQRFLQRNKSTGSPTTKGGADNSDDDDGAATVATTSRSSTSGGRRSPTPMMSMKKMNSQRFFAGVANTAKGGAGLVANTAKGGAGLAAKGAMGGAGLALKGAKGGAGLAVKGAKGGAGLAAKGAMGGAGLALKGAKGGAGLAVKGVSTGVGVVAGGAGLAGSVAAGGISKIKSAKSNLLGELKKSGDIDSNVMAIYGSELYSVDFITKEIGTAIAQPEIDTLVVEDLILRGNSTLDQAAINLVKKTALIPNDQPPSASSKPDHLEISVRLFAGEDLAACDSDLLGRETTSDPYVIISILPNKGPEIVLGKTKHCIKTLNPTWNFQLSKVISPESFPSNVSSFKLQFKLMDFDLVGDDDCMGIVQIPLEVPNNNTKLCKEPPKWHVVPADSAEKASGRIKVAAEWNRCYGQVMPETVYERHWKRLTFCDNVTCVEDYKDHTNNKREFQSKVRKVLRLKDINKFPIKFETKVEIMNLDVYETIGLLNLIAKDQTVLQFTLPYPDSEYDTAQSSGGKVKEILSGKDIKKLPKIIANKFDKDTLEWKDDAEPLLIHIKYGNKPKDKKKTMKHTILFRQCSARVEQVAKKSANFDEEDLVSEDDDDNDNDGGASGAFASESSSSLPKGPNQSEKTKEKKPRDNNKDDSELSSFRWSDHAGSDSGTFASKSNASPYNMPYKVSNQSDSNLETKLSKVPDDSDASSFCWDDYDGGYSGIFASDSTCGILLEDSDEEEESSSRSAAKDDLRGAANGKDTEKLKVFDNSESKSEAHSKALASWKSKQQQKRPSSNSKSDDDLPWDEETNTKIRKLREQRRHVRDVIDYAKSLAPFNEAAKEDVAKRVPQLFELDRQIDELMGLGAARSA